MSPLGISFLLICSALVFVLPRNRAVLPLIVACLHISYGQGISIFGAYFTIVRLLIVVVLIRITIRGEWSGLVKVRVDNWMTAWACLLLLTSFFHREPMEDLKFRGGYVLTSCGIYWAFRALIRTWDECEQLLRTTALFLVPLAVLMMSEKMTHRDFYSIFGGVPLEAMERNGKVRAAGPFLHPILAGTAGATLFPMLAALWKRDTLRLIIGGAACLVMVLASASSGPLISLLAGIFALFLWRWRRYLRKFIWGTVFSLIALHMVMRAPVWWLMARVDFTGSSTGYFRAALIDAAIEHASEWVVAGTDTTRDWMATGVGWSDEQTDITNYFLNFGVMGGLPTMIAFIGVLMTAFLRLRDTRAEEFAMAGDSGIERFLPWALGCSLFAHAVTFLSVSYFDQTMVLWFATVAMCTCYPEPDSMAEEFSDAPDEQNSSAAEPLAT
jgi:hypothetical protein